LTSFISPLRNDDVERLALRLVAAGLDLRGDVGRTHGLAVTVQRLADRVVEGTLALGAGLAAAALAGGAAEPSLRRMPWTAAAILGRTPRTALAAGATTTACADACEFRVDVGKLGGDGATALFEVRRLRLPLVDQALEIAQRKT
jgi:hypothetical protein